MSNLNKIVKRITEKTEKFEYSSFMIGTTLDSEIIEREDVIRSEYKIKGGEPIKSEITKELSKLIKRKNGKIISLNKPELNILVNTLFDEIEIKSRSIFVMGRYIKRKRGVNQKKQRCKLCKSEGCKVCKFSGFIKMPSIENEIQKFLMKKFKANEIKISWIGSEDQNSLVKYNGRPFFAEVTSPIRRKAIFREKKMNHGIVIKSAEILRNRPKIDQGFIMKSIVNFELNLRDAKRLKKIEDYFTEKDVSIYSMNKRKYFTRRVISVKVKKLSGKCVKIELICEGGINIKKLVSGENDQVKPNFRKVMRLKCSVDKMAPFDVHYVKVQESEKKLKT
jgi:tRNA pseudouridine synthase 10